MERRPYTPDTPLYLLLKEKLRRDPLDLIAERRDTTPPVSYARIAQELRDATSVYITHEVPRRWHQARQADERRAQEPAAPAA